MMNAQTKAHWISAIDENQKAYLFENLMIHAPSIEAGKLKNFQIFNFIFLIILFFFKLIMIVLNKLNL